MRASPFLATAAAALAAGLLAAASLQPALARSARVDIDPAEEREFPYDANIPGCQDREVLETVTSKFAEKEHQYWATRLQIVGYENIQRTAWRPWGLDYVPRRFCTATATISDGVKRKIDYSVREGLGPFGASWGVEFCVQGLDRNWAYSPSCLAARP